MFLNMRLKSKDPQTRIKAVRELQDDQLLQFLQQESDWDVKLEAAKCIRKTELIHNILLDLDHPCNYRAALMKEFSRRMHERADLQPEKSRDYCRLVLDLCIHIAQNAKDQSTLELVDGALVKDREIVDFLIAIGMIYQEAKESKKAGIYDYPYKGYERIRNELAQKLSDPNEITRLLAHPYAMIPYKQEGELFSRINDKEQLLQIAVNGSEHVREAAKKRLESFDTDAANRAFKNELQSIGDVQQLVDRIMNEKNSQRIIAIADRIAEVGDNSHCLVIEQWIRQISADRDAYPPQLRASLINVYGKLAKMQFKEALLYFADEYDLDQYQKDLNNPDNIMGQIFALKDLQALYKMGRFRNRISAMQYDGQPVPTYKGKQEIVIKTR